MKNPPIIIIGAGRSGTNILRDSICSVTGIETWPCDEINYIWRHGNINHPTDRFDAELAIPNVSRYIQKKFKTFEIQSKADYVVEKTCANSLRVPFINSILPDARFLFLLRDGRDVASSARQRWTAPLDLQYIWQKAKYVPVSDVPYYAVRYFYNRVKKITSNENRLAYWGPVYPGMMRDLENESLIEVCARQWAQCVQYAYEDLEKIDPSQVHCLRYESFVNQPFYEMQRIFEFLQIEVSDQHLENSIDQISPKSINNHKKHLTSEELGKIDPIISPVMDRIYQKVD